MLKTKSFIAIFDFSKKRTLLYLTKIRQTNSTKTTALKFNPPFNHKVKAKVDGHRHLTLLSRGRYRIFGKFPKSKRGTINLARPEPYCSC